MRHYKLNQRPQPEARGTKSLLIIWLLVILTGVAAYLYINYDIDQRIKKDTSNVLTEMPNEGVVILQESNAQ